MLRSVLVAVTLTLTACEGVVPDANDYPVTGVMRDPKAPQVVSFSCTPASVSTKTPVQCTMLATNPGGAPITCTLDPGDGHAPIDVGDCTEQRDIPLRFGNPGMIAVRLEVKDTDGRGASRLVSVDVSGPANVAPTITALTASPAHGVAPLNDVIGFTAADPDGDPITCAVDVGADGTVEFPAVDCAAGQQAVVFSAVGATPVKLTVSDDRGGSVSQTVTVTAVQAVGDLRISQVDWGQSIIAKDLRLVGSKKALLRVSVLASAPGLAGVVVTAVAKKGATVLGTVTLDGPATPPTTENLGDLSKQYRTTLPAEWVQPGLEVSVAVDPADVLPETDETNNTQVLHPAVGRDSVLHLTSVPIVMSGQTATPLDVRDDMVAMYPLKDVETKVRAPYTTATVTTGTDLNAWGTLLGEIATLAGADGSQRHYYGWIPAGGGGIAGLGYIGQGAAIGLTIGSVAPHELGHNFGRPHAPCGGAGSPDPGYPYPNAQIGSWGFDGTRLISPTSYVDLMSYCSPTWISDYNYKLVQGAMEGDSTFVATAVLPYAPGLVLSGSVTGDQVKLAPAVAAFAALTPRVDGDLSLRLTLRDGTTRMVSARTVEVEDRAERHFLAIVPDPGPLASVEVLRGGRLLFTQLAPAPLAKPDVDVTRVDARTLRVRWNVAAWPLLSAAHLSDERTTLALRLPGGEALVRTDGLTGGRLELSLSNGLTSERLDLPLPE